jgi:hypothetical protein
VAIQKIEFEKRFGMKAGLAFDKKISLTIEINEILLI